MPPIRYSSLDESLSIREWRDIGPQPSSTRVIAGILALAAFTIAIIVGLSADLDASVILERAIFSLVGCFVVGCGVGALCESAVATELKRYLNENPAPNSDVTVEELMAQMQREYEVASSEDAPTNTKNSS